MFTLTLPITLPDDRSFFAHGHPLPLLRGKYLLSFDQTLADPKNSESGFPFILKLEGFETKEEAEQFLPKLVVSIRWASLALGHSLSPSTEYPKQPNRNVIDGWKPAIIETARGYSIAMVTGRSVGQEHISKLGDAVEDALSHDVPTKFFNDPKLKLAFELYSEVEFAGGTNAKFIVLISALEIFVPPKANRGAIVALVKNALSAAGQPDVKATGKAFEDLYVLRNQLLHEGMSVNADDLKVLREIVGRVLRALVTTKGAP